MAQTGDIVTHWFNSAGRYKVLPKSEVINLSRIINSSDTSQTDKKRAIDKLVKHNMKMVVYLTMRFLKRNAPFPSHDDRVADYLQMGTLGLHRACQKYDPALGYEFSTYAARWIRCFIQRHHYTEYSMIYVPENVINMVNNPKHPKAQSLKMKYRMQCAAEAKKMLELDRPIDTGSSEVLCLKDVIPDPRSLLVN